MAETEVLKAFYVALNRSDLAEVLGFCDTEIERTESFGFPSDDIYRGYEEMRVQSKKKGPRRSRWT